MVSLPRAAAGSQSPLQRSHRHVVHWLYSSRITTPQTAVSRQEPRQSSPTDLRGARIRIAVEPGIRGTVL